jgi:putative FmdB family regulatory protein
MPIYEYICLDCKKEYEILRSFNEADKPMACNECGGENVKRKLSVVFAQSGGHAVSGGAGGGCSSCSGGNCSSCGH